jgi:hypothetical protein
MPGAGELPGERRRSVAPGAVQMPGANLFLYQPAEFQKKADKKTWSARQRLAVILSASFLSGTARLSIHGAWLLINTGRKYARST